MLYGVFLSFKKCMRDELLTEDGRYHKRDFAKQLRNNSTPQEVILWEKLRRKQCCDMKFRRQVPIGPDIVDFLCLQRRLIIEVDGGIHKIRKTHDRERDAYLASQNYTVLRFTNDEVETNLSMVLSKITAELRNVTPKPPPAYDHINN